MKEYRLYGPPGCLAKDTQINYRRGKRNSGRTIPIELLYYKFNKLQVPKKYKTAHSWKANYDTMILSLTNNQLIKFHIIDQVIYSGKKELFKVTTNCMKEICVTAKHPFKIPSCGPTKGFKALCNLIPGSKILCRMMPNEYIPNGRQKNKKRKIVYSVKFHPNAFDHWINGKNYKRIHYAKLVVEASMNKKSIEEFIYIIKCDPIKAACMQYLPVDLMVHHDDENILNDDLSNLKVITKIKHDKLHGKSNIKNFGYFNPKIETIASIKKIGIDDTYDIVMKDPYHNYIAQGFIVHNTGKTSRLATQSIPKAIKKYGNEKVMVVSFTKTGAKEIAMQKSRITGRTIDLPKEHVGTIHSICYHALGEPTIIEIEKKLIQRWNEENPGYQITGQTNAIMDNVNGTEISAGKHGDEMLSALNIRRNKMITTRHLYTPLKIFEQKWKQFKEYHECLDFTDLIEKCLKERPYAPDRPSVLFIDEAQDSTKLQLTLARSWGNDMKWIMLTGDDDQTIFAFAGATPDAFLTPSIPKNQKSILQQSYRVPQEILKRANKLILQITKREPKEYKARKDHNGKTVQGEIIVGKDHHVNWRHPGEIINKIENDQTTMILASCSYMLAPTIELLRSNGIAFHNPYRTTRGDWNPLNSKKNSISSKEILINFLSNGIDEKFWNIPQFITWAQYIKVSDCGLKHGLGKKALKALKQAIDDNEPGLHTSREILSKILTKNAVKCALNRDIGWLTDNLIKTRKETIKYPLSIYSKSKNIEMIEDTPKIIIGTIHSVKGAQADCVILFPDISIRAARHIQTSKEAEDSITRVFYVGMTRARQKLTLAAPSTKYSNQKTNLFVEL